MRRETKQRDDNRSMSRSVGSKWNAGDIVNCWSGSAPALSPSRSAGKPRVPRSGGIGGCATRSDALRSVCPVTSPRGTSEAPIARRCGIATMPAARWRNFRHKPKLHTLSVLSPGSRPRHGSRNVMSWAGCWPHSFKRIHAFSSVVVISRVSRLTSRVCFYG